MNILATPFPRHEPLKTPPRDVPPLQDGDRLTRAEFERRYEAMPELKKAELIEGVVHMGSPVTANGHAEPHFASPEHHAFLTRLRAAEQPIAP